MESPAQVLQRVRDEARRRNVRWTNQRQAIVETFVACDDHLTVEELHRRVRLTDPSVSAATVYRTINMLTEIGVAIKRQFGSGSASFERSFGKDHHDHLVCTECGAISEFNHELIEKLQEEVASSHHFLLKSHRLELYGICALCRAKVEMGTESNGEPSIAPR